MIPGEVENKWKQWELSSWINYLSCIGIGAGECTACISAFKMALLSIRKRKWTYDVIALPAGAGMKQIPQGKINNIFLFNEFTVFQLCRVYYVAIWNSLFSPHSIPIHSIRSHTSSTYVNVDIILQSRTILHLFRSFSSCMLFISHQLR